VHAGALVDGHILSDDMHEVAGRIMLGGDKERLRRDRHAAGDQSVPNLRIVEDGAEHPGIDQASVPAACSAIKGRAKGIVDRRAAMAADHDERREGSREPHNPQRRLGEKDALVGPDRIEIERLQPSIVGPSPRDKRVSCCTQHRKEPERLDAGKCRKRMIQRAAGKGSARRRASCPAQQRFRGRLRRAFIDRQTRAHQNRRLRHRVRRSIGTVPHRHAKEPGEAKRLVRPNGLEMSTQRFRARVDTENHLRIDASRRSRGRAAKTTEHVFAERAFARLEPFDGSVVRDAIEVRGGRGCNAVGVLAHPRTYGVIGAGHAVRAGGGRDFLSFVPRPNGEQRHQIEARIALGHEVFDIRRPPRTLSEMAFEIADPALLRNRERVKIRE
jgi:hypothetical protein